MNSQTRCILHAIKKGHVALITVVKICCGLTRRSILGDPGATSRDEAIFSGESLLQELRSPWELILTEPVPEVVEFRPTDWLEKSILGQSSRRSSRASLSPSYTKWFTSSIDLLGPYNGKRELQKKRFNEIEELNRKPQPGN